MKKQQVKKYMLECYKEHVDNTCNVLNTTSLAEDAGDNFDLYSNDTYDIMLEVYDLAIEVELELIKQGLLNK